jgi:RimJ/RimL family protein N-acetyltransferase
MIETERLLHRKFTLDDLDKLIEMRTDDDVIKYMGGQRLQNPQEIEKRLRAYIDSYEKNGYGSCAMIWKATGEMIGWSGLQPMEETGETEVGYGMVKQFWGRGIGFETAKGWLEFGFGEKNLDRIVAFVEPENTGSWRIMEKLGMRREKIMIHFGMECLFYAITKDEFLKKTDENAVLK